MEMPTEGSSYYEYLCNIPIGAKIEVSLSGEPQGSLDADKERQLFFTAKKSATDAWLGVKNEPGTTTTRAFFEHVQAVLAEVNEDVIRVCHGKDPRKVKQEIISEGLGDEETTFFTINEVIELDSDNEECDGGGGAVKPESCRRWRYESVMLSLKDMPSWSKAVDDTGATGADAPASAAAAPAAISAARLMVVGKRFKECFRANDADTVGTWYGGLVLAVYNDRGHYLCAYDDGDMHEHSLQQIQGLIELGKIDVLTSVCGLVDDVPQAIRVIAASQLNKGKEVYSPVGALLGDGDTTLCGQLIYSSHHLSLSRIEEQSGGKVPRPSRGGRPAQQTTNAAGWPLSGVAIALSLQEWSRRKGLWLRLSSA